MTGSSLLLKLFGFFGGGGGGGGGKVSNPLHLRVTFIVVYAIYGKKRPEGSVCLCT